MADPQEAEQTFRFDNLALAGNLENNLQLNIGSDTANATGPG